MGGTKTDKVEQGIRKIIEDAIRDGASDIHIEPREQLVAVRYRIGGSLQQAARLPKSAAHEITEYLKQLAGLETWKIDEPQSGRCEFETAGRKYDLQVFTLPVFDGEKITIHIEHPQAVSPDLSALGYWGNALTELQHSLSRPSGLVLAGGQRGPKLLLALLKVLDAHNVKTIYINDTSAKLPPTTQEITLTPRSKITAAEHLLRQKASGKVVAVAAVHDRETAEAAVEAAKKSLVVVGLPGLGAVRQLSFLAQALRQRTIALPARAAISQTEVRGLCSDCSEVYDVTADEQKHLAEIFDLASNMAQIHRLEQQAAAAGLDAEAALSSTPAGIRQLRRVSKTGCTKCGHTGYAGTVGLVEVLVPDDDFLRTLMSHGSLSELQNAACRTGMISLPLDGLIKTLRGQIDLPTLLRAAEVYSLPAV